MPCVWEADVSEAIYTPFLNCGWKHLQDGTCSHPQNVTPECHQHICPIIKADLTTAVVLDGRLQPVIDLQVIGGFSHGHNYYAKQVPVLIVAR
jgi:hypothetical protein